MSEGFFSQGKEKKKNTNASGKVTMLPLLLPLLQKKCRNRMKSSQSLVVYPGPKCLGLGSNLDLHDDYILWSCTRQALISWDSLSFYDLTWLIKNGVYHYEC